MNFGKSVFSQLVERVPHTAFRQCVERYQGNRRTRTFSCWDQFLCLAFAQLTYRESLRDIEACLRAMPERLYHMGIRGKVSRSTLAEANEQRDWRIYGDLAQVLISMARPLYVDESFGVELQETVYALDSSTIDLCLSLFPWAHFKSQQNAVKLHTLLDLRGPIPCFIRITEARVHDVNILDELLPEPGAFYVLDRGYLDFARLFRFTQASAFFITRARRNFTFRRVASFPVDKASGLRCDQHIRLKSFYPLKGYPDKLRRIRYWDAQTDHHLTFLTNNLLLPALTIAQLYQCRWQIELFFKWIKQHLRIQRFYGTSSNAVKTQVWTAICVYLLVAIVKKQLKIELSLYTILQILSLTLFEKTPISQVLTHPSQHNEQYEPCNQLNLFNF
ncbi:MAG: IS4 family transposase [Acidobacteriota bacterium]